MIKHNLNNYTRGWLVGKFDPSLMISAAEVGLKRYQAGDCEASHHHKIGTEITVIVSGTVMMNDQLYQANDIIVISPGESTDFKAITDAVTLVLRDVSIPNDKYLD